MKKAILILLFLSLTNFLPAQILVGPQLGFNIGTLHDTKISVDNKFGWHGGLFLGLPLSKHLFVMPAVLYSNKGFKYDYGTQTTVAGPTTGDTSVVTFTANVDASLGYLDVPIMLTIFTGQAKGLFLQAGPQFSYLIKNASTISTTSNVSINGGSSQPSTPTSANDLSFHKADFSLAAGIGYKLPSMLMVYARVSSGYIKVQKDGFITDENAGKNFMVEVGGALVFGSR